MVTVSPLLLVEVYIINYFHISQTCISCLLQMKAEKMPKFLKFQSNCSKQEVAYSADNNNNFKKSIDIET